MNANDSQLNSIEICFAGDGIESLMSGMKAGLLNGIGRKRVTFILCKKSDSLWHGLCVFPEYCFLVLYCCRLAVPLFHRPNLILPQ